MYKASDFFKFSFEAWGLIIATGVVASVATILGFLGPFSWFLDLFSHFRVQYFIALSVVSLLLLIPKKRLITLWFGFFAIVNLSAILPLYFVGTEDDFDSQLSNRLLLINVNTKFGSASKVIEVVQSYNPDIVVLEEIDYKWLSQLRIPMASYLYSEIQPREDNFGIALYSKYPFIQSSIEDIGNTEVPSIIAEIETNNGKFTILATHPLPPTSKEYSFLRDKQLNELPQFVRNTTSPVILIGDLNTSPWSCHFKKLLKQSGLKDSSQGRGVHPTWPSYNPLLLIPIDHCLYSSGIKIIQKKIGPKVGSDHYPVIVDFIIK